MLRRSFIFFLAALMTVPSVSIAKSRDEVILEESVKAAARAYIENQVKGYLNRAFAKTVEGAARAGTASAGASGAGAAAKSGSASGSEAIGVGSYVLFAVQLGLAADDFMKAKDDKGKTYATANAVAAGVTLVNPVAGLIVAAVIIIVQMVDAHQSAMHAKDMMAIYERIAKDYQKSFKLEGQMAKADEARFAAILERLSIAQTNVQNGRIWLEENCVNETRLNTLGRIDDCLQGLVEFISEYQNLANLSSDLLNTKSRFVTVEQLLQAIKQNKAGMEEKLANYNKSIMEMKTEMKKTLKIYAGWTAEILITKALIAGQPEPLTLFKQQCLTKVRGLTLQAIPFIMSNQLTTVNSEITDKAAMLDAMDFFTLNGCAQVKSPDVELEEMYSRTEKRFFKMYSAISKTMGVVQ